VETTLRLGVTSNNSKENLCGKRKSILQVGARYHHGVQADV